MGLTVKSAAAIKAGAKRQEVPAGGGLYLIVQPLPSAARSWAYRYRSPTNPAKVRKLTLGSTDRLSLAEARVAAVEAGRLIQRGVDPVEAQRAQRATARDRSNLVDDRLDDYLAAYEKAHKASSYAEVERLFRVWVRPAIGQKRVDEVERRDVQQILDAMVAASAPVSANRLLAAMRPFWAGVRIAGEPLPRRPTDGVAKAIDEAGRDRDRVLSDKEIRWLWMATEPATPFNCVVRVLLLTGQRRGEVSGLVGGELDLEADPPVWLLPGARAKNGRENLVPLSSAAVQEIRRTPHVGRSKLVFTSTVGGELSGWSKSKRALDQAILAAATVDTGRPPNLEPWTLHDLRRTAATGMARLGEQPHVIEAILNHKSGAISKIAGIYNRHAYFAEKTQALTSWAKHLLSLHV